LFFQSRKTYTEAELPRLLDDCQQGKEPARAALVRMFLGFVKTVAVKYAGNSMEAEEIVSDVFLKVFQNLPRYDATQPFKAWLRTISVNTSIDYYRKNVRFSLRVDIEKADVPAVDEEVLQKLAVQDILALVQRLTPAYRMVFSLYVLEGYNHRQIAEMLSISEGTSKSNLQDARRKLQHLIFEHHPEMFEIYSVKRKAHERGRI
jgi:RNA polymerase sigma-70 factor (ECF subfamily)